MNHLRTCIRLSFVLLSFHMVGCAYGYQKPPDIVQAFGYDLADYKAAAGVLSQKSSKKGYTDNVGYWMDLCAYLHYAGDYEKSSEACWRASARADELYTKSMSEQGASYLTSDKVIAFQG